MGHHHDECPLVDRRHLRHLLGPVQADEAGRFGEALAVQELASVVHDDGTPPEPGRRPHERRRVVAGAADEQAQRWLEHLDEHLRLAR